MTVDELMLQIFQIKQQKKELEDKKAALKAQMDALDADIKGMESTIDVANSDLLSQLTEAGQTTATLHVDGAPDILAEVMSRETNTFDDAGVVELLRGMNSDGKYSACLNIKCSVKKSELNKVLKTDSNLASLLETRGLMGKQTTRYVLVEDQSTMDKVHMHINESKAKKA